jgi:hypothetical protein
VINQIAMLSTFVAPLTFLALIGQGWQAVAVAVAICWVAGSALFWMLGGRSGTDDLRQVTA